MRVTVHFFAIVLGSLCPFGGAFATEPASTLEEPPSSDPVMPAPRDRDFPWMSLAAWNDAHRAHCAEAEKGQAELIFLGDSITAMTVNSEIWRNVFAKYRYANFGIGGDCTQNVLWRLENGEVGNLKPKLVVLLIGTNNIGITDTDIADTERGVAAVVEKLKSCFPTAKILLLGIFPRDEKPDTPVRAKVRAINAQLLKLDDKKRVVVRDLGGVFLESDGTLSSRISSDQLHLTEAGMQRWAGALEPEVARLMR